MLRRLILVSLLALPALASAQGNPPPGQPGQQGGQPGGSAVGAPGQPGPRAGRRFPTPEEFENGSPLAILLDHRQDLALTDKQVQQLTGMREMLHQQNAPIFKQMDSMRAVFRARAPIAEVSEEERQKMVARREAFTDLVVQLQQNEEASTKQALGVLTDTQLEQATKLLAEERERRQGEFGGPGAPGGMRGQRPPGAEGKPPQGTPPR